MKAAHTVLYMKKHTQTYASYPAMDISCMSIDSIVKGLETAHVRPLKRVRTPRAILVTSCYELSQFRATEKERTRKIKDEEDASSRSYEIFNNIITF